MDDIEIYRKTESDSDAERVHSETRGGGGGVFDSVLVRRTDVENSA